jgi:RNA polymerase sigma-70 factor (ECF subfamily)
LTAAAPSLAERSEAAPPVFLDGEIRDDQLRLIFTCCHPALSEESQVALTLKTLCGFGVPEIARALLADEGAVAQRLVRAKRTLREGAFPFVVPEPRELPARLDAVLTVLYLMFNEGYNACDGPDLTRPDLCREAIYLAALVREHPVGSAPRVDALLALFCLQAARLPGRVDANGDLCLLADQNRSRWDRRLIERGLDHLAAAARGDELSAYHLEAGIAACHAVAASDGETDWRAVLASYDALVAMTGSAVAKLNRAVAVARVHGPQAGLAALEAVAEAPALRSYYLLHATRAALQLELGNWRAAADSYAQALPLTRLEPERRFLERKLQEVAREIAGR